jgi:hypothetical protein
MHVGKADGNMYIRLVILVARFFNYDTAQSDLRSKTPSELPKIGGQIFARSCIPISVDSL